MDVSLENFQAKFVEEALDNIAELETTLLELDLSPRNKELLEKVFRIMHTLKGGGAMFGFEQLSSFAHDLENVYDRIRLGKLSVTSSLLTLTLESVDLLRDLLDREKLASNEMASRCSAMLQLVKTWFEEESEGQKHVATDKGGADSDGGEAGETATWYIHFYPGKQVLENGNNLLYLLDDLSQLGTLHAVPRAIDLPDGLEALKPTISYLFWDLFLATDAGKEAIRDVFIFVDNESVIEIQRLSKSNLFESKGFVSKLESLCDQKTALTLTDLNSFVEDSKGLTGNGQPVSAEQAGAGTAKPDLGKPVASSVRVSSEKIDGLMNLVSELVITQERLNMIAGRYQIPELKMVTERVQKLTGQLRDSAFSMSLIPLSSLLARFQRLVRDLGAQLGKRVEFVAEGAETELDKTMIDSLTDPLLHILRNSLDHGIEVPAERIKAGKDPVGKITLEAGYAGANVVIKVKDDGAGVDEQKVRRKALERGLISENEVLTPEEVLQLLFVPGFSTAGAVTEVSGRGVGMDVVKRNIAAVRGEVALASEKGRGSCLTITLPLVLSIIDGLLVRIGATLYVLPLSLVDRIYATESRRLENNFIDVLELGGRQIPYVFLRKEFGVVGEVPSRSQVVVVRYEGYVVALVVDQVVGKFQAVLKPLGKLFHGQKMISAATIMGDGSIALVLDTSALIRQVQG